MAEVGQIIFSYKEVAEALIKKQGIHEGIWGLWFKFGMKAANIGETNTDLKPAIIVPILGVGLQKFDKETEISVDAAKVNPKQPSQ